MNAPIRRGGFEYKESFSRALNRPVNANLTSMASINSEKRSRKPISRVRGDKTKVR